MKAVCKAAHIDRNELCGKSRKTLFVVARHVFCFHAVKNGFTLKETGRAINRNCSTVNHSIKAFENLLGHFPMMDRINREV
jgi:chromosomal replication initiation ATPase DnaA